MKATAFVGLGVMSLACAAAQAQTVDVPQHSTQIEAPQAPQAPAAPGAPDGRRQDIRVMELALIQALQTGAQDVARQLRVAEPTSAFVTGSGRARGFVLDGYGMFFDVDVPGMKQSVVWSGQMVQLARDREEAQQAMLTLRQDDPLRRVAEERVRQIDRLMVAAQAGQVLVPRPLPNTQLTDRDRRIQAATESVAVADTSVAAGMPLVAPAPAPPPPAAAAAAVPEARDPNQLYTESVKSALIDTMLRYSAFLKIADNEWLTVAASDGEGPPSPNQLDDASRIVIRVKGSDLAAFQSNRITRAEVLKRVEVREY